VKWHLPKDLNLNRDEENVDARYRFCDDALFDWQWYA
jgi:hypothetical protein